ncbi:hypothetical protein CRG98_018862 [Punica granatum]|uniref:Uncharacterized protein n=1 Tax=Punica granatum TaxID=22663 RepID=A0A2I0JWW4_PUNGR|nr:hypothetical protein CRG98_018862 [Punica granatum]
MEFIGEVNSAPVTRPRAQPSVRHHARARARVRAAPVTAREFLLPSPPVLARPSSAPHVLSRACMHACARDAPNVCPRIRALVTACPSTHHRATKRLPTRPTPPRTPSRACQALPCPLSSIQGLHRVTRLSNTSSTLSLYPEAR